MSTGWAAKLANPSSSKPNNKPGNTNNNSNNPKDTKKAASSPSPSSTSSTSSNFNSNEILSYLNSTYNTYLQSAKEDKAGEKIKVYKSLESSSQWKTKQTSGSKNNGKANNKYNPRNVIRSNNKDSNDSLDLIFEINRSIYQQQKEQQSNKK